MSTPVSLTRLISSPSVSLTMLMSTSVPSTELYLSPVLFLSASKSSCYFATLRVPVDVAVAVDDEVGTLGENIRPGLPNGDNIGAPIVDGDKGHFNISIGDNRSVIVEADVVIPDLDSSTPASVLVVDLAGVLTGVFSSISLGRLLFESETVAVVLSGVHKLLTISLTGKCRKLSPGSGHVEGSLFELEPGLEDVGHVDVVLVDVSGLVCIRQSRRMSSSGFLGQVRSIGYVLTSSLVASAEVLGVHLVLGNLSSGTGILKLIGDTIVISADGELILSKVDENRLNLSWRGLQETSVKVGTQLLSSKGGLPARNGLVDVWAG